MKTILLFVVSLAFSLYVQGGDLSPAPDNSQALANADMASALNALVDALDALEGKTPTSAQLSQIVSAWKRLPEPTKGEFREDVIYMSCAGLLAIGDTKSFGKARSGIPDMDAFRNETMESCPECDGSGIVKSRCTACDGSGRCGRCGGRGSISVPRLAGTMTERPPMKCPSCQGSGHCASCNGGTKETRHAPCNGTGRRISRESCLAAFELHRANAREEAFAIIQKEKGLGDGVSPAEEAKRNRFAEEGSENGTHLPGEDIIQGKDDATRISDYLFNPVEMQKFFSEEMTTAKQDAFAARQYKRGLLLAHHRCLFAPIPDGTVFKVVNIYRDMEYDADILPVKVELVSADNKVEGWEFMHSVFGLGSEDPYRGTDWPNAPWKGQTEQNCNEIIKKCFPEANTSDFILCMYRTAETMETVLEWNQGTFLMSKGWYSVLPISTSGGVPDIEADYWIVPSDKEAWKMAFHNDSETTPKFFAVGPRTKADRILARMENLGDGYHHDVQGLENLLRDLVSRRPAPGRALGHLIESVLPESFDDDIPEIKDLVSSANGKDRAAFEQSLARAVKKLSEYNSLPASAAIPANMRLDERLVGEFYAEGDSWRGDGNKIRQLQAFERLWNAGSASLIREDYHHVLFLPFPDGISFVVRDVSEDGIRYQVCISPLVYGEPMSDDNEKPWTGNPKQNKAMMSYLDVRYGTGDSPDSECFIDYPLSDKKAANWDIGTIIKSDGWVCEVLVEKAKVTTTNRHTGQSWNEEKREVSFINCFFPSIKARLEIERAAKEWQKRH